MTNVLPLFQPNADRIVQVRRWFMDQGMEPTGHVAAVSVSITSDGQIKTQGCGIEPEHAAAMLDQLKALVARLEGYAADQAPELLARTAARQDLPANVIQLRH